MEALLSLLPALNFDHIVNSSVNIQWDAENMKLVKDGVGFLIKMGHRVFVSVRYRLLLGLARAAFPSFQWDRPFKQTMSKALVAPYLFPNPSVSLLAYKEATEHLPEEDGSGGRGLWGLS